jgi:CMP-N-acetylneuraminic acid synthetase
MYNRIVGIIPARGGSKGLPRKNITILNGKPLISYSIEAGKKCRFIEEVYVTTEDTEIKTISSEYGAKIINRPNELSTDTALTRDVVLHSLKFLKSKNIVPEYFVLLQPTSPLRTYSHLNECLKEFFASKTVCGISVTKVEHHPYKSFYKESGKLVPLFGVDFLDKPRQLLPSIYRQNGAIYTLRTESFLKHKSFFIDPVFPYFMKKEDSIDIDTYLDLQICEYILRG